VLVCALVALLPAHAGQDYYKVRARTQARGRVPSAHSPQQPAASDPMEPPLTLSGEDGAGAGHQT